MRALYQVLVIPFPESAVGREYAVLLRSDEEYWQWVAGGGGEGESPGIAAQRELAEELGDPEVVRWLDLESVGEVPSSQLDFGTRVDVPEAVPEFAFAAELSADVVLVLSQEHSEVRWVPNEEAAAILRWESNVLALDELESRFP